MAILEEKEVVDLISILEDGSLQVRKANVIYKDDVEIHRTYHREVKEPGDDLSGIDPKFKKINDVAGLIWTKDVVDKYKEKKEKGKPKP